MAHILYKLRKEEMLLVKAYWIKKVQGFFLEKFVPLKIQDPRI